MRMIDLKTLTPEIFTVFGTQNALLSAGDRKKCNTMTIGWCGLGRTWNLPSCTVFVRPERYTYEFMERQEYFTVSVLPLEMRETMKVCGTQSGRDIDKFKTCGMSIQYGVHDAPFPAEAEWVLVCRKLYVQDLKPECALDERVFARYQSEGWHRMYIGEVVEAYAR